MGGFLSKIYDILTFKICCPKSCHSTCCDINIENDKDEPDKETSLKLGSLQYTKHIHKGVSP